MPRGVDVVSPSCNQQTAHARIVDVKTAQPIFYVKVEKK